MGPLRMMSDWLQDQSGSRTNEYTYGSLVCKILTLNPGELV